MSENVKLGLVVVVALMLGGLFAFTAYQFGTQKSISLPFTDLQPATSPANQPATNPNLMANAKTFTNLKGNFSFKYPSNLVAVEAAEGTISLYQNQSLADEASSCTYGGAPNDPCPPPVLSFNHKNYLKSQAAGVNTFNALVGGGVIENTTSITAANGKIWTVGQPLGLKLRPDIRTYTETATSYQFVEVDIYLVGLWRYTNQSTTQPSFEQATSVGSDVTLPHAIIATFSTGDV